MLLAKADRAGATSYHWSLGVKSVLGFWALHLVYRAIIYAFGGQLKNMLDPALILAMAMGVAFSFELLAVLGAAARRGLVLGLTLAVVLALPVSLTFATGELALYYHLSPEVNGTTSTRTMSDGTVVTQHASGEISY